jgi:hypothetical protein
VSFRFQRRIKLVPGLHLNLSKRGVGFSAGRRGIHVGIDSRKRPYWSAGVPGTGLSWREYEKGHPAHEGASSGGGCGLLLILVAILLAIAAVVGRQ